MPQLLINIDEITLSKLLLEAISQEVSLEDYLSDTIAQVLQLPVVEKEAVDIERIIEFALDIASTRAVGEEFLLHQVCGIDDWNSLSSGERKRLGREFRKAVENRAAHIAVFTRRTSGNAAVYRRI